MMKDSMDHKKYFAVVVIIMIIMVIQNNLRSSIIYCLFSGGM